MVFDTARGLGTLPTPQLVRSTVLLHACASRAVVLAGCALLRAAVQRPEGLGRPALLAARHTFFRQFVAGERLADVKMVAARLRTSGVRCIVDHSTEELEHAEVRSRPPQLPPIPELAPKSRPRARARARRGGITSTLSSSSSVGCARRSAACRPPLHPLCTHSAPSAVPLPPLLPPPPPPPPPPSQLVPAFRHPRPRVATYAPPLQMRDSCAFVPVKPTALAPPKVRVRVRVRVQVRVRVRGRGRGRG